MNQVTNMHEYKSLYTKHWNKAKKHKIYSTVFRSMYNSAGDMKGLEIHGRLQSKGNARLYCAKLYDIDNKYQKN